MFTAAGGPTDVPHVMLEYSVRVMGKYHATNCCESTQNVLGTLE